MKFDVFLSYSQRDYQHVEALANRLRDKNLMVFLDRWYLKPGQSWITALESALARCGSVAICIGPGEMGPWQQREKWLALERQSNAQRDGQTFPVIPVLLPGSEPPLGFLSQNTWVDFRSNSDDGLAFNMLTRAIGGLPPGQKEQEAVRETQSEICPYRGLQYFREEMRHFFVVGQAPSVSSLDN